ncbi:MAG: DUF4190 domain-containing protein [Actinomycetota bacterium]
MTDRPPPLPPPPEQPTASLPEPPPQAWAYRPPSSNGMAIAAMILGIVGLFMLPFIGPVLALVFGYISKGQIDRSAGREGGRSMAVAGIVLGYVGLVTSGLWIAYFVWFFNNFEPTFREILRNLPTPTG